MSTIAFALHKNQNKTKWKKQLQCAAGGERLTKFRCASTRATAQQLKWMNLNYRNELQNHNVDYERSNAKKHIYILWYYVWKILKQTKPHTPIYLFSKDLKIQVDKMSPIPSHGKGGKAIEFNGEKGTPTIFVTFYFLKIKCKWSKCGKKLCVKYR